MTRPRLPQHDFLHSLEHMLYSDMAWSRTWICTRAQVDSEREERGSLYRGQHSFARCEPSMVRGAYRRAVRRSVGSCGISVGC